jgi:4-carboxymuconolactone decarboxylase
MTDPSRTIPQGFGEDRRERLPPLPPGALDEAARAAAERLLHGPRRGVKGPFVALLRSPELLDRLAAVGEHLRFGSVLPRRVNELATLVVARHVSNQFEWAVHHPLALAAGTAPETLDSLARGSRPRQMSAEEATAFDFAAELVHHHGVSEDTYAAALARWGEQGVVELTALLGYFVCVSWLMNVARTPAPGDPHRAALHAFPP